MTSSNLITICCALAEAHPELELFTFWQEKALQSLSAHEFVLRAKATAAFLQKKGFTGKCVILNCRSDESTVIGFWGCILAGAIAVPVSPPTTKSSSVRFKAVLANCGAEAILATHKDITTLLAGPVADKHVELFSVEDIRAEDSQEWQAPVIHGATTALIQYTSGSTGNPNGVIVTHANLINNAKEMQEAFGISSADRAVFWLPLYHDMGLIGGIIQPVYSGYRVLLMSPLSFLEEPMRWLRAISHWKATLSGGPNFAYELCAQNADTAALACLDLSSWRVAFNGSEMVRWDTLQRFAAIFAKAGLNQDALRPCYGLAEATLLVSASNSSAMTVLHLDSRALKERRVREMEAGGLGAKPLMSAGKPAASFSVLIVNPDTLKPCEDDEIGEIWLSGPSIGAGYWKNQSCTNDTFAALLHEQDDRQWLRTGDLGFVRNQHLYIADRLKDIIIIRGQNFYPQDIERSVCSYHPLLKGMRGAAFSLAVEEKEELVVVHEIARKVGNSEAAEILRCIYEQIAAEYQVTPHALMLVRARRLPRTTSGKVQRSACREAFVNGTLKIMGKWPDEADPDGKAIIENQMWGPILEAIERAAQLTPGHLHPDLPLKSLALDSVKAAQVKVAIEKATGAVVPLSALLQDKSLREIAQAAQRTAKQSSVSAFNAVEPAAYPLSAGQRALWFLQQVEPQSPAYTIARAFKICGKLDSAALQKAFAVITERHATLRMRVAANGREMIQDASAGGFSFDVTDASEWSETLLQASLAAGADEPFDLNRGPVLRVHLFVRSDDEAVMLLCMHHIACDLESLRILADELSLVYPAIKNGEDFSLPPLSFTYADFVQRESELVAGPERERLLSYWNSYLGSVPPPLALPGLPRQEQTSNGATEHFGLTSQLSEQLFRFSREHHITVNALLLAAFEVLLYRYTEQKEFLVGTLSSGRDREFVQEVVGYVLNPLALKADFTANLVFSDYVQRVYKELLQALDHDDLPFSVLVEQLHSAQRIVQREPFNVLCILQPPPSSDSPGLTPFIMGRPGGKLAIGDLLLESLNFKERGSQFDLTLVTCNAGGHIIAALNYSPDSYDSGFIARMAGHYQRLLSNIVANPAAHIDDLNIITEQESSQIIEVFNDPSCSASSESTIHTLIEEQADKTPANKALVHGETSLTYSELDRASNKLAHYLRSLGTGVEDKIGIYLERSVDLVIAILAVLKAGAAYVPLDPSNPSARIASIISHCHPVSILTTELMLPQLASSVANISIIALDREKDRIDAQAESRLQTAVASKNLAYVMHTSGSTGVPKGVMIEHRSVLNFFRGMDIKVPCESKDTLFAVTSAAFDISVLELLWTLTRGCKVVLADDYALSNVHVRRSREARSRELRFSLFYFASAEAGGADGKYGMLLEGAKLGDELGLHAVWTPERHFHEFGGLYSNPALTSAALAMITRRIQLRAGSVVLPLHHPIRVAEEWSFVDNISAGRIGIAFASGWHADDFVFAPDYYSLRKEITYQNIETVRKLWRGETIVAPGGAGSDVRVRIYPQPIQPELPIWITAAGAQKTFEAAGEIQGNVLTHLLGQELSDVGAKVLLYRQSLERTGVDPESGAMTLMLHTFIHPDAEEVRRQALIPFKNYLRSSVDLIGNLVRSLKLNVDLENLAEKDLDDLLTFAAERYMGTSGLLGTPKACAEMVESVRNIGVTEIACLVDFGVDFASTLNSIRQIAELQQRFNASSHASVYETQPRLNDVTLLQCTPSLMQLLLQGRGGNELLGSLRMLLLGGEPVPPSLINAIRQTYDGPILNMYGPTETTIWSAALPVVDEKIVIGGPIINTQIYVLRKDMSLAPIGTTGEVSIGGMGLARGYLYDPKLTAERFLPDPFSTVPGARLYRTGDLGRLQADGKIDLLGRGDQQIKLRGHRIELGEIESVLNRAPGVRTSVVILEGEKEREQQLVGYLVASSEKVDLEGIREFIRSGLPPYMMPKLHVLPELPLNENGKVNRKALRDYKVPEQLKDKAPISAEGMQETVQEIWKAVLKVDTVSVDDNFFDVGGHSLLMVQVHEQLQRVLHREFPLIALLRQPTIRSISEFLENSSGAQPAAITDQMARQRAALISHRNRVFKARVS